MGEVEFIDGEEKKGKRGEGRRSLYINKRRKNERSGVYR